MVTDEPCGPLHTNPSLGSYLAAFPKWDLQAAGETLIHQLFDTIPSLCSVEIQGAVKWHGAVSRHVRLAASSWCSSSHVFLVWNNSSDHFPKELCLHWFTSPRHKVVGLLVVVTAGFLTSAWKKFKLCCLVSETCRASESSDFCDSNPTYCECYLQRCFKARNQCVVTVYHENEHFSLLHQKGKKFSSHLPFKHHLTVTNLMQISYSFLVFVISAHFCACSFYANDPAPLLTRSLYLSLQWYQ